MSGMRFFIIISYFLFPLPVISANVRLIIHIIIPIPKNRNHPKSTVLFKFFALSYFAGKKSHV